ncbi:MerC domain-containing protein [Aquirufa aurantiipilula]|uniref:MerC domain-containing protein n=1 Tax=Aquirufa aurantiipilula TaxID=2696561 RepID=A0ABT6BJZ7_9BACT|nr:MerC domain-containing protein [Aquirufa aurantiipilula]MBZ1326194.1 MerC domain-containing protein [Aquirufa aurantiipilula]MDF5690700.1 MerC domain-containing protein [Aquirufa aurantiipilula]
MKRYKHLLGIEKMGLFFSIACAIHCMTLPIFLFFAPYIASSFAFTSTFEWILVSTSFLLALILLFQDFKRHRKPLPMIYLGLAVLVKVIEVSMSKNSFDWAFGLLLGIFISIAYWVNYKHKVACTCKIKHQV